MSPGAATGTLYLIDAHSLIFQVFHAIRGMSSPSGLPTNALFGFIRDILFLRSLAPDYLLCAFDRAEPTFRSALYADYKAHREAMPDDLQIQIPLIYQALEALGVPVVSVAGYEADDILATVAPQAEQRGLEVLLCTSDKDCRQLITDRVQLYSLRKRERFGRKELLDDWGITPEQVVDLQALVGDSVDNIPGVAGIGVKTAAKLLQEFGTLDNLLVNADKVSGAKRQESLRGAGPVVGRSLPLVRLARDVPLTFDWDAWKLRPIDTEQALALCREWGFQNLAGQIRTLGKSAAPPSGVQGDLFAAPEELFPFGANRPDDAPAPAPATEPVAAPKSDGAAWQGTYRLIATAAALEEVLAALDRQPCFAIDLETTGLDPFTSQVVGVALSWQAGEAAYLALRGPSADATLDPGATLERLRPILEDATRGKVNQNIKFDSLMFRAAGITLRGIRGDSMVADYLLHAGERSHGLEELSRRYLNHQVITIEELIGKKGRKQSQLRMDQVPTARVAEYAGEDADVAWRLTNLLEARLDAEPPLRQLYDELEVPLIDVLVEMEANGIALDVPYLASVGAEMAAQLQTIEAEIYALAGYTFNIGSLPQLRKVLFEELKLPVQGKTGITGVPSTDQESLEKLAALDHPGARLPRKILEQRQIAKLKGTYVDALPGLINPKTGRLHTSFNQTVTATGRLSSTEPNLQNIPVRREMGQQIRRAFVPRPGWSLLTADYSQIELRLLAHFCGDERLRQAFAADRDIHAAVAAEIFGVAEEAVTAEQRRRAKTVNFGVIYGISPVGLGQRLGISREEATAFIAAYFQRYALVEAYQTNLLRTCRQRGYVSTILGRRRRFDAQAIRDNSRFQHRNQAEREAINMEVQGSAADLIKLAMLHVHRRMQAEGVQARLLLQIHDELVFEVPPAEQASLAALVREEMTGTVARRLALQVPLQVDLAVGPNWLDVESIREVP